LAGDKIINELGGVEVCGYGFGIGFLLVSEGDVFLYYSDDGVSHYYHDRGFFVLVEFMYYAAESIRNSKLWCILFGHGVILSEEFVWT